MSYLSGVWRAGALRTPSWTVSQIGWEVDNVVVLTWIRSQAPTMKCGIMGMPILPVLP